MPVTEEYMIMGVSGLVVKVTTFTVSPALAIEFAVCAAVPGVLPVVRFVLKRMDNSTAQAGGQSSATQGTMTQATTLEIPVHVFQNIARQTLKLIQLLHKPITSLITLGCGWFVMSRGDAHTLALFSPHMQTAILLSKYEVVELVRVVEIAGMHIGLT